MGIEFRPATMDGQWARVALVGVSGGGKTYTGLRVAIGLVGDPSLVAVIDAERGSSQKYKRRFRSPSGSVFAVNIPTDGYSPQYLIQAVAAAADQGYQALVIDSLSAFWSGTKGMLDQVNKVTERDAAKSAFGSGWREMRPVEQEMFDALLSFPGHVIVTMRAKTQYLVGKASDGKATIEKVGLEPEQRRNIEYEFDLVGDMVNGGTLCISKSRMDDGAECIRNGAVVRRPGEEFAEAITDWLADCDPLPTGQEYLQKAYEATSMDEIRAVLHEVRWRQMAGLVMQVDDRAVSLEQLIVERGVPFYAAEQAAANAARQGATPPVRSSDTRQAPQDAVRPSEARGGAPESQPTTADLTVQAEVSDDGQPVGWCAEWVNGLGQANNTADMNRLMVELERARRRGDVDEPTVVSLRAQHQKRVVQLQKRVVQARGGNR